MKDTKPDLPSTETSENPTKVNGGPTQRATVPSIFNIHPLLSIQPHELVLDLQIHRVFDVALSEKTEISNVQNKLRYFFLYLNKQRPNTDSVLKTLNTDKGQCRSFHLRISAADEQKSQTETETGNFTPGSSASRSPTPVQQKTSLSEPRTKFASSSSAPPKKELFCKLVLKLGQIKWERGMFSNQYSLINFHKRTPSHLKLGD